MQTSTSTSTTSDRRHTSAAPMRWTGGWLYSKTENAPLDWCLFRAEKQDGKITESVAELVAEFACVQIAGAPSARPSADPSVAFPAPATPQTSNRP